MRLFLGLMLVSCAFQALAQEVDDPPLFPEFSNFQASKEKPADEIVSKEEKSDENLIVDSDIDNEKLKQDLFEVSTPTSESPNTENSSTSPETMEEEEESEKEEDKDRKIYLFIDGVKATLTPNRNASFCTAVFAVANRLKKPLKAISGTFTVGSMTKQFSFTNIAKEGASGLKYTFIGTSCEEILNEPAYTVKKCQIEGWSEKKCKNKVEFVPIPKEENHLK